MKILVSNDDGVHSLGLRVLVQELERIAQVWVVAPLEEKSASGHSLTLHHPLRLVELQPRWMGVNGSPADCVYLGLRKLFGQKPPDLVLSGINRGANLGQDIHYSGTVSAAREACITGIPGLAVSLVLRPQQKKAEKDCSYQSAAQMVLHILKTSQDLGLSFKKKKGDSPFFLNLNVPDLPWSQIRGLQWTRQGRRNYRSTVLKRRDHHGKEYYWIGGLDHGFYPGVGTDCEAVDQGFASLTPLQIDSTNQGLLERLRGWAAR